MNLSGSLRDVSIHDVLRFLRRGGRTGVLRIRRAEQKATVAFRKGEPISVRMPGAPRLGDLLLASGLSDEITVREAARVQAEEESPRPLGQILVAHGAIDKARLEKLIGRQLRLTLTRLLDWACDGGYSFFDGEPEVDGDLCLDLGHRQREGDAFTAQLQADGEVLLAIAEATLAERHTVGTELVNPDPGDARIQVLTSDPTLYQQLAAALPPKLAPPAQVRLERAGTRNPDGPPPILLFDLRQGDVTTDELTALRESCPEMPIVAVVDEGATPSGAYTAGAQAVVPAQILTVVACLENVAQLHQHLWNRNRPFVEPAGDGTLFDTGDLEPAMAALHLMQSISGIAERAILFAPSGRSFAAIGAFGTSAEGDSLAELTRGLTLDVTQSPVLCQCIAEATPCRLRLAEVGLPEYMVRTIGAPKKDEVAIFPVVGRGQKVISLLYTDNGALDLPLGKMDAFETATAQFATGLDADLEHRPTFLFQEPHR